MNIKSMHKGLPGRAVTAFALGLSLMSSCFSAILRVPANYPTLQAAIDAAAPSGDEIVIGPGVYRESALVEQKQLVLTGEPGAILQAWPDLNASETKGLLTVGMGSDVAVRGLKFDGARQAQVHPNNGLGGLIFSGGSGRAEHCVFEGFRGSSRLGSLWSVATYAGCPDDYKGAPIHVVLRNNEFNDNACAILMTGSYNNSDPSALLTTFAVLDNTIRGVGPTALDFEIGLFVGPGTSGLVKGNQVSDHFAILTSQNRRQSAAILMTYEQYHLPHQPIRFEKNTLRGNQQGIAITEGDRVEIIDNVIEGRGPSVAHHGIVMTGDRAVIAGNQFSRMAKGILLLDANNDFLGTDTKQASQTLLLANRFCDIVLPLQQDPGVWGTTELATLECLPDATPEGTFTLSPAGAYPAATVVIAGPGLAQARQVLFSGTAAGFSAELDGQGTTILKAVVPPRARTGPVMVITDTGALISRGDFNRLIALQTDVSDAGRVKLRLPLGNEDCVLQSTSDIALNSWQTVIASPTRAADGYEFAIDLANPALFFRLSQH